LRSTWGSGAGAITMVRLGDASVPSPLNPTPAPTDMKALPR